MDIFITRLIIIGIGACWLTIQVVYHYGPLGLSVLVPFVGAAIIIIMLQIKEQKCRRAEEQARIRRQKNEEQARIRRQKNEEQARIRRRKEEEQARIRRHKAEQDGYRKHMVDLGDNSITVFESMPKHLESAEGWLDQAQFEFSDGAFAPFWDSIENAAKWLAHFDQSAKNIEENLSKYTDTIRKYEDEPPQFPLARKSVEKLSVGTATAERMQAIVRTAQRNFQFASIYEQRKTNQILVAGFTNLAQALDQMTWQITGSIKNLARSVDSIHSRLGDMEKAAAQRRDEAMRAESDRHSELMRAESDRHTEVMKVESDRARREKRALEMLDNIEHRRKPLL